MKTIISTKDIKDFIGNDWSNLFYEFNSNDTIKSLFNTEYVRIIYSDLRDIILPEDEYFFDRVHLRNLSNCKLPEKDYSEYIIENMTFDETIFTKNSKLPKNIDFFKNQKTKNYYNCVFPIGDYSHYDFDGIRIRGCDFQRESIMPEYAEFLEELNYDNTNYQLYYSFENKTSHFELTDNMIRNIHNYSLDNISIDLREYADKLTLNQLNIIKTKYENLINETVFLPEEDDLSDDTSNEVNKLTF